MGYKSRPQGWPVGICLADCKNQGTDKCKECFRKNLFEPNDKKEGLGCQTDLKPDPNVEKT